jgi:hypothetical protein
MQWLLILKVLRCSGDYKFSISYPVPALPWAVGSLGVVAELGVVAVLSMLLEHNVVALAVDCNQVARMDDGSETVDSPVEIPTI